MAAVYWDAKGILLVDYLQTGKTINSEYYCNLLDQFDARIREKRPVLQKKNIIFHQDNNAPAHKSDELLKHPPYSSELTPSDFWLFSHFINSCVESVFRRMMKL